MLIQKQKGFTLIEIIVVLVILGVLSAIALPNIFSWIQRSQAAEAFVGINSIKSWLVPCLRSHVGSEEACFNVPVGACAGGTYGDNSCNNVVVPNVSSNFQYKITNVFCPNSSTCNWGGPNFQQGWNIVATALPVLGGPQIWVSGNENDTATSCWGIGSRFVGVC